MKLLISVTYNKLFANNRYVERTLKGDLVIIPNVFVFVFAIVEWNSVLLAFPYIVLILPLFRL